MTAPPRPPGEVPIGETSATTADSLTDGRDPHAPAEGWEGGVLSLSEVDGSSTASSHAGSVPDDATLIDAAGPRAVSGLDAELDAMESAGFDARYEIGEAIGRGGMGDVRLAKDTRIGRTVALKLIREEGARRGRLRARFLFEARMQGQLEHPSIVPVYDLGVRPDGSEYFTMRRVRGRTLAEVLRGLRVGDQAIGQAFSRRRLLAAFQSVCLAVEFAHQRGVVHRDLKPANIMLGEFGEVILLDWGLAKLRDPAGARAPERAPLLANRATDMTAVGEVLGSPGYMSPEQAIGARTVGAPTDIFALGAILFEILTLRRLVDGADNAGISANTRLGEYDAHIGKRFPELEIAAELEAVCVQATDFDARARQPRARDLADAVASHLEGDRDVSRRRQMASRHARAAMAALAESVQESSAEAAKAARARAIREVNHALAIDPTSQTALRTMMTIIREAPLAVAPETDAAMRASEERALRMVARRGTIAYLVLGVSVALMGALGVVDGVALGTAVGCFLAAAAVSTASAFAPARFFNRDAAEDDELALGRRRLLPEITVSRMIVAVILLSSCGIAASSRLFGPLVYVPSLAGANVVVFAAGVGKRYRTFALLCGLLAVLAPLALEGLGVLEPSWTYRHGVITILPRAVELPGPNAALLLAIASVGAILFPVLLVGAERDARVRAERELVQKERALAEFVPAEAGEALSAQHTGITPPTA